MYFGENGLWSFEVIDKSNNKFSLKALSMLGTHMILKVKQQYLNTLQYLCQLLVCSQTGIPRQGMSR